jgi:hypothetical protein
MRVNFERECGKIQSAQRSSATIQGGHSCGYGTDCLSFCGRRVGKTTYLVPGHVKAGGGACVSRAGVECQRIYASSRSHISSHSGRSRSARPRRSRRQMTTAQVPVFGNADCAWMSKSDPQQSVAFGRRSSTHQCARRFMVRHLFPSNRSFALERWKDGTRFHICGCSVTRCAHTFVPMVALVTIQPCPISHGRDITNTVAWTVCENKSESEKPHAYATLQDLLLAKS